MDAFKSVAKTAGCDVDEIIKCTQTPYHTYTDEKCVDYVKSNYRQEYQKYYIEEYCVDEYYYDLDHCAVASNCFDSTVKIDWGSINYQKIAENEYGKPIT